MGVSSSRMGSLPCTPLMCVAVATILPPRHQALLRSAGTAGVAAYNEVVAQSGATTWAETDDSILVDKGVTDCVPCTLPLPAGAIVDGLVIGKGDSSVATIGDLPLGPINRVRYEGGPDVINIQGVHKLAWESVRALDPPRTLEVQLCGFENVVTIGTNFLHRNCSVTALTASIGSSLDVSPSLPSPTSSFVDISSLQNVKTIQNNFMSGCASLTYADLTPFKNVTHIGDHFLFDCTSLTSLNLNPLSSVTGIGTHFLANCIHLKSVDMKRSLSNIVTIGDSFMSGCSSLLEVGMPVCLYPPPTQLSRTGGVTTATITRKVGDNFMKGCILLPFINLSLFSKVTEIGHHFMTGCKSLKEVDVSHLRGVERVGPRFMGEGATFHIPPHVDQFSKEMQRALLCHEQKVSASV